MPEVHKELTDISMDNRRTRSEVNTLAEQYATQYELDHGRSQVSSHTSLHSVIRTVFAHAKLLLDKNLNMEDIL